MMLRRSKLMKQVPPGALIILKSNPIFYKAEHIFYPFRQQSDFMYFTGFNEPGDSAVVFRKLCETQPESKRDYEMTMFVQPRDAEKEMWEGPIVGIEGAMDHHFCDKALPYSDFSKFVEASLKNAPLAYMNLGSKAGGCKLLKSSDLTQEIRCVKSESELEVMRRANLIASESFISTMKFTRPGLMEKSLEARLEYECKLRGAQGLSFVPVVAGGNNATIIHYTRNDSPLHDGDLVLIDGGADLDNYVSDIARSYPINGKYSIAQARLYNAVLKTQIECIKEASKPGMSLDDLHLLSEAVLYEEIRKIGINIPFEALSDVYNHHVGHYLGMDVHDVFSVSRSKPLQPGNVITIEPGIYISELNNNFPKEFRGIGIRIEDNIIIGHGSVENMTTAPKEIEDIEQIMSEGK